MGAKFDKYAEETGLAARWEARTEVRVNTKGIITVLRARFGAVPQDICESIQSYSDVTALNSLLESAAICGSINEFRQNLVR